MTGAPVLETAASFLPAIREQAETAERNRRVSPDLVRQMAQVGLFNLLVPSSLGGAELDVATMARVFESLSTADGSAGWVVMIGGTTGIISGYLEESVAQEIFRPGTITGGVIAPKGNATAVDGGYKVSGRWPFASGCQHSDWLLGTAVVIDESGNGTPSLRQMVFPAADAEIIDTWDVAGLRATGSHDIALKDVFVPAERSFAMIGQRPAQTGTLYSFPLFGLLSTAVASVALGIGRAALDELRALAPRKTSVFSFKPLSEAPFTHGELGRAEAALRSARAFLFETIDEVWETVDAGNEASPEQRAILRLAATNATVSAARAVDAAYNLGGGSSIYQGSPLQRQFRDIHVATQHIATSPQTFEMAGGVLLGAVPPNPML